MKKLCAGIGTDGVIGTMSEFFPECSLTHEGLHMLIKAFSWPRGFASHLTAHIPGELSAHITSAVAAP